MLKVHLDTDLGGDLDDLCALATLLKWPNIKILGITTVTDDGGRRAGFTRYALRLAGKSDIPVKAGADVSLGCYRIKCGYQDERYWPGSIPKVENSPDEALELLKKSIKEDALIIGIGPFTNLYLLDKKYPGILRKAKLFLMGGYLYPPKEGYPQWKRNYDFNIEVDVVSAKHVLENSQPTLIPLTVTIETFLRRAYLEKLRQSDDLGKLIAKQAEFFAVDWNFEEKFGKTCSKLPDDTINFQHDSLTCAVALGWKGVKIEERPLKFEVKDTWLHEIVDKEGKMTKVVTEVDGEKFSEFWLKLVTGWE